MPDENPPTPDNIELAAGLNILAARIKTLEEELAKLQEHSHEQEQLLGATIFAFQDMAVVVEEVVRNLIFDGTEDGERKAEFEKVLKKRQAQLVRQLNDAASHYATGAR